VAELLEAALAWRRPLAKRHRQLPILTVSIDSEHLATGAQ
jgi:hypothetical protein